MFKSDIALSGLVSATFTSDDDPLLILNRIAQTVSK